jgi:hypothetical protein
MATDAERARAREEESRPEPGAPDAGIGVGGGAQSVFTTDGERFVPTEQARGPWDPRALHGGAPAALTLVVQQR